MAARSTLADRLKLLRAEHGGSVQEVADAVGVSRSYLSGIENDHDKPGYESFVALADYYRVSLDWLAKGPPHPRTHRMPDTQAEFLQAMLARTRALRLKRGFNQKKMAKTLGVPYENYRQYERRSPMPHFLIPRFAAIVQEDVGVVLTGRKSHPLHHPPNEPHPPTGQG